MKILLVAVNAKYIHSNPAIYSLRAYVGETAPQIELLEATINHYADDILREIYRRHPDVVAFSCYIWNISMIGQVIAELPKVLPDVEIWAGGPEVSYDAEDFLRTYPQVAGVMTGEGEATFRELAAYYAQRERGRMSGISDEENGQSTSGASGEENSQSMTGISKEESGDGKYPRPDALSEIRGITWRDGNEIVTNPPRALLDMDEIPFIYENMDLFEHRIVYYESSRGCPFSCSYCLSSNMRRVRFRSMDKVTRELQFFLDQKVDQVKFVDRTFNCNHAHALTIWNYLAEHDNGVTNFHFEIAADLLNEEELALLQKLRPGLVQLEIGVQSTNRKTIREIDRVMDFAQVSRVVRRVQSGDNIHQHLDLIAGLPYEDFESFCRSFNDVYGLFPDQLQLGFLKVLKGTKMERNARDYGLRYHSAPVYEALSTKWISYEEMLRLKAVEEMLEVYYNSGQFAHTMRRLESEFESAFAMYAQLADYYERRALNGKHHSRQARFEILLDFIMEKTQNPIYRELLTLDAYLREKCKSRPSWMGEISQKEEMWAFYKTEEQTRAFLPAYSAFTAKQMMHMTHLEHFSYDVLGDGGRREQWLLFDYRQRNPRSGDAAVREVEIR